MLKQQGHFYDMNCLAYSPDGQLIATGGDDSKVRRKEGGRGARELREGGGRELREEGGEGREL